MCQLPVGPTSITIDLSAILSGLAVTMLAYGLKSQATLKKQVGDISNSLSNLSGRIANLEKDANDRKPFLERFIQLEQRMKGQKDG